MLKVLEDLLVLQEHDRRLADLRREMDDLPNRKAMAEERLSDQRRRVAEAEEARKKNAAAIKQIEIEIETLREQIGRLTRQQFEVKNNDQYRALQTEMAAHRDSIRALEDREIELMEEGEARRGEMERLKDALAEAEKEVAAQLDALERRAAVIREEWAKQESERAARASSVPAEWMARYERIMKHHRDRAIVPVENQACGGCHMKLPPQTIQDTRRAQAIVTCGFCGRLLYWKA